MREALEEAKIAYKKDEIPVGCVIVKGDEIIARGHNLVESSKLATQHAEIIAINVASKNLNDWRLEDCTLYTTLEPCIMCAGAILQSRVGKVVYGASDNLAIENNIRDDLYSNKKYNTKIEVVGGILSQECSELLNKFFRERREKK